MIYIHWIILAIYSLIVLLTMITILMDNRQPAKTMAWILVLVFLPAVGIILYFFFGQNIRRERLINQNTMNELTKRSMLEFAEQRNLMVPDEHKNLINLFANQDMSLPFKDNEVDIYKTGHDFILALLQAIGSAQNHIHLETYIIEDDPLGRLITDALIDKAAQGVEVRFLYDDVGCWRVPNTFFERMRESGIEVHAFMPVKFPAFTSKINYRNHRKLCTIDGKIGFIGGMNLAMRYVNGKDGQPWRDTHLQVRGGAVYGIQRAFLIDWYFADRTLISGKKYYPNTSAELSNNCLAQVVTSTPVAPWASIMQAYVRILMQAHQYVYMETPYFLPTDEILFAIRTAALTGVDIRIMVPLHSDSKIVEWAGNTYLKSILEAGVEVYFYQAGFNHSKLLVADDKLCTCGSTNIDFRSFENNFESNIFFYDKDMATRIKQVFLEDLKQSVLLKDVKRLTRRPFLQRLLESLVRLMAPLL